MMPFGPVEPGVFDRVASRRLRPQGAEWVLEAEGIRVENDAVVDFDRHFWDPSEQTMRAKSTENEPLLSKIL